MDAKIRLYDKLFTVENPLAEKGKDFKEFLNPSSLVVKKDCKCEPLVKDLDVLSHFQFERQGYFTIDPDTDEGELVISRTVGLRDTWAKVKKQQGLK